MGPAERERLREEGAAACRSLVKQQPLRREKPPTSRSDPHCQQGMKSRPSRQQKAKSQKSVLGPGLPPAFSVLWWCWT